MKKYLRLYKDRHLLAIEARKVVVVDSLTSILGSFETSVLMISKFALSPSFPSHRLPFVSQPAIFAELSPNQQLLLFEEVSLSLFRLDLANIPLLNALLDYSDVRSCT